MKRSGMFILVALAIIAITGCEKTGSREELVRFYNNPFTEKYAYLFHSQDRDKIIDNLGLDHTSLVQEKKDNPESGFSVIYPWGTFVYTYANGFFQLRHLEILQNIPIYNVSFFFGGSKEAVISRYGKPDRDFGDGMLYGMSKDLMNVVTFTFTGGKLSHVSLEFLVTNKTTE